MRFILIDSIPVMTKTLSLALVHFCVAFAVGFALPGSWVVGGALALVEPACNTLAYHWHEKVWARIEARRRAAARPQDDVPAIVRP